MKVENIRKIGIEKGVKEIDVFVSFLSARFPYENDKITSYFSEWADRFNSKNPELFMDKESLAIYKRLTEE